MEPRSALDPSQSHTLTHGSPLLLSCPQRWKASEQRSSAFSNFCCSVMVLQSFFFFWTCFFEAPSLVHENFCHPLWSSQLKNFRPYLHSGDPGAVPTLYRWPLSFLRGGNFIKTAFPHLCEPWAASSVAAEGVEEPGGAPLPLGGFVPVLQTVARLLVRVQIVFRFLSGSMWLFSCILGERK